MAEIIKTTFQFRRGLEEAWRRNNPLLAAGEPGYELDTHRVKIGNGISLWNDLPYFGEFENASNAINDKIATLDAAIKQTAGKDGLALQVTQVDGVLTAISGSIAANTYDKYGAATAAIAKLEADKNVSSAKHVVTGVTQVDGVIASIDEVKLADVAFSGSIDNLKETENTYVVFNCGSSSVNI